MTKLFKKEVLLALHPTAGVMLALSAMVLIPSYPYTVIFFYTTLALFFMCMMGRENNDIGYTVLLPIEKGDIVRGRICFAVVLQLVQLLLVGGFSLFRGAVYPSSMVNAAGMEANLALLGMGLLLYAVFNLTFFPSYYKNPSKIGVPFICSSVVTFLLIGVLEASTYVIPWVRSNLDVPIFSHPLEKCVFFAVCAVLYAVMTYLAMRISIRRFNAIDL